jgi:hypothetical protein
MNTSVNNLYPSPSPGLTDEALSVDNTAGGVQLAASGWSQSNTKYVDWQCQTDQIRVTFDGSAPTTTNGFLLNVNQSGSWSYDRAKAAKFIRVTNTAVFFAQPATT